MEFDKGFMSDSMFGKTVSELTAERQKKNMDIISDILSGARAEKKSELAATAGAPLGIMFAKWAKSKMGDGKDNALESARGVEDKQNELTELLKTTDYTKQEQVTKLANIYYENGDEATGRAYTNMARSIGRQSNVDAFYDQYTLEQLEQQAFIALQTMDPKKHEAILKAMDRKNTKVVTANPQGGLLNTGNNVKENANNNNNQGTSVVKKGEDIVKDDGVAGATVNVDATTGASAKKKKEPSRNVLIYK